MYKPSKGKTQWNIVVFEIYCAIYIIPIIQSQTADRLQSFSTQKVFKNVNSFQLYQSMIERNNFLMRLNKCPTWHRVRQQRQYRWRKKEKKNGPEGPSAQRDTFSFDHSYFPRSCASRLVSLTVWSIRMPSPSFDIKPYLRWLAPHFEHRDKSHPNGWYNERCCLPIRSWRGRYQKISYPWTTGREEHMNTHEEKLRNTRLRFPLYSIFHSIVCLNLTS